MFDIGFLELSVVAVVALIVLGPERLPRAARTVGLYVGKARRMMADVKADIDREIARSDLEDVKKDFQKTQKEISKTVSHVQAKTTEAEKTISDEAKSLEDTNTDSQLGVADGNSPANNQTNKTE